MLTRTRNRVAADLKIPRTSLARFLFAGGAPATLRQEAGRREAFFVDGESDLYFDVLLAVRHLGGRADDAIPVCMYLRGLDPDARQLAVASGVLVCWLDAKRRRWTFYKTASEIPFGPGIVPAQVAGLADAIETAKAGKAA